MFYRQGDVLIQKVKNVQGNLKQNKGDVIIAFGEVTGHAHRFKTENGHVELYEKNGTLFVKVTSDKATITHEEHNPVTIPQGSYQVNIQREYAPDMWRYVVD